MSKSHINTTSTAANANQSEQQSHILSPSKTSSHPHNHYSTHKALNHINAVNVKQYAIQATTNGIKNNSNQAQSSGVVVSQFNSQINTGSKQTSSKVSVTQSINNANGFFAHNKQTSQQNTQQQSQPLNNAVRQSHLQTQKQKKKPLQVKQQQQFKKANAIRQQEEEKTNTAYIQQTQQPQRPLHLYENNEYGRHKPTASQGNYQKHNGQLSGSFRSSENSRGQENGEKMLNKRHQMRLTSGDPKKASIHNITRSMISEGSEDFTNIEERLQEDTRISCRNAVASSLNNVTLMIKQVQQQHLNVRNRRGTTQSNRSGPSNQPSKEETFETSSFFDEGVGVKHIIRANQSRIGNVQSPHRCNQVDGYNIPTIFNTLMFGIDQSKVSNKIRESFSNLSQKARPSSQIQTHPRQATQQRMSNKFAKKKTDPLYNQQQIHTDNKSQPKLSEFVTKVDKSSPIMVFDQSQQQYQHAQLNKNGGNQRSKSHSKSPKNGRSSQLSMAASQQNLKDIDGLDSLSTEVVNKHQDQDNYYSNHQEQNDVIDDIAQSTANQIEDFQSSELHRNHLIQTLQSLQYIKTLPPVNKNEIRKRQVALPPPRSSHITKTIIFDLDETLVHCIDDIENNPCDQIINVTFPNGETVQAGINVRPYALECLRKANENYQVVVFTASHKSYADVVLDSLDPDRTLIQYRLYRDHCIRTEEGIYIKDLRIITNRNLKDVIIVDNAVYSFGYQLDNGIPIIPFYDDKSDEELMHLIFYFNCLASCPDVRDQNRKAFQLKDLQEIDIQEYLQSMTNQNNDEDGDDNEQ